MNVQSTAEEARGENFVLHAPTSSLTQESGFGVYKFSKRGVDFVISLLFLLLAFVPLLLVALLVSCTSRGPVLFKQKRLGLGGEIFWCLKFRTMVVNAEEVLRQNIELQAQFSSDFKLKNDPRITPVGQFLRKTSLDELPQFVNVLRGEMSLIGPRPIVPLEISKYGLHGDKLLTVKPGLGGLWQASGRSDVTYEERITMDMSYIDSRSLRGDLMLLLLTAASVCRSRGAY